MNDIDPDELDPSVRPEQQVPYRLNETEAIAPIAPLDNLTRPWAHTKKRIKDEARELKVKQSSESETPPNTETYLERLHWFSIIDKNPRLVRGVLWFFGVILIIGVLAWLWIAWLHSANNPNSGINSIISASPTPTSSTQALSLPTPTLTPLSNVPNISLKYPTFNKWELVLWLAISIILLLAICFSGFVLSIIRWRRTFYAANENEIRYIVRGIRFLLKDVDLPLDTNRVSSIEIEEGRVMKSLFHFGTALCSVEETEDIRHQLEVFEEIRFMKDPQRFRAAAGKSLK